MTRFSRRLALPALAIASAVIACSPWFLSGPTPTVVGGGTGGPRYLSAPPPAGYLLADPAAGTASIFAPDGRLLEILPDMAFWRHGPTAGAAASPLLTPSGLTQIAYLHAVPYGVTIDVRQGADDRPLSSLEAPVGLSGSIPAGYIAVSDVIADAESDGQVAVLYVIEISSRQGAGNQLMRLPILGSSPRPLPLAIDMRDGSPSHVYYTLAPQGERAGGSGNGLGLFVLDVATGQVVTFLDENNVILAVSPDQTFVAFLAAERTPPEVRIARLDGTSTVLYQPVSGARAVLGAAFSPDSSRIVWVTIINEAGIGESWQVSLASTFGGPTSQMDLRSLIPADLPPVRSIYPVAWITDTSILLQVEREGSSSVYRYQVDAGDLGPAGAGVFISLFYP